MQIRRGLGIDLGYLMWRCGYSHFRFLFIACHELGQQVLDMLQLLLLYRWIVGWLEVHSIIIVLLCVRVGCKSYISIIIRILLRYDRRMLYWSYLCLWWARHLLLHVRDMLLAVLLLFSVAPCLPVSVRMLVVLLVPRPLWSSRMLWCHPGRWWALVVFWTGSKKLVKFV